MQIPGHNSIKTSDSVPSNSKTSVNNCHKNRVHFMEVFIDRLTEVPVQGSQIYGNAHFDLVLE